MMLHTSLEHIMSEKQYMEIINTLDNVMICCGRMGPMCVPVYHVMELLRDEYPHVAFLDMEFDLPDARVIRDLPECRGFMGLPFTVYVKNGKPVAATSSAQSREQVMALLDKHFGKPA
jgi:thioredoxin 1